MWGKCPSGCTCARNKTAYGSNRRGNNAHTHEPNGRPMAFHMDADRHPLTHHRCFVTPGPRLMMRTPSPSSHLGPEREESVHFSRSVRNPSAAPLISLTCCSRWFPFAPPDSNHNQIITDRQRLRDSRLEIPLIIRDDNRCAFKSGQHLFFLFFSWQGSQRNAVFWKENNILCLLAGCSNASLTAN